MSAESSMLKARAQLLMDQPFFGTLALRLKLVQNEDIGTAATDGQRLLYASKFIAKLDPAQLKGLIAHEVMHCVFNHMTRRQQRDEKVWNVAADLAINNHLLECGFILPDGGLVDKQYANMTAEAIYNKIKDDPPKQCPWGLVIDSGTGTIENGSAAALESEWQVAVTQAVEVAKQRGKLPASLQSFVQDIVKPKVDWRSVLWPFLTSIVQNDFTWSRPNRAYISEDEYMPSMRNEAAGQFAVILDTSGSITNEELEQFLSEILAIHSELEPEQIVIVQCDARVNKVVLIDREERIDTAKFEIVGRGGTAFEPAFTHITENYPGVEAAVYLTDLESDEFGEEPPYPVLWISTSTQTYAPWGQVVRM